MEKNNDIIMGNETTETKEISEKEESREKETKEKVPMSFKDRDMLITAAQEVVMLFWTIVISVIASFVYGMTMASAAEIVILSISGFLSTLFCIGLSRENSSFLFDNEGNIWRFTISYLIFLCLSVVFPILPAGLWPYPVVFVGLMLFSNQLIGMSAGCTLLMLTSLVHGDSTVFFIYFVTGLVGIVVFSYANEVVHVWLPLMITLLVHMVCLTLYEVLLAGVPFSYGLFTIPALNVLVCLLLLLFILKISTVSRDWNRYMDINDPESPLLAELKIVSEKDYYHAIHTAYLCEKSVKNLFLDPKVVKACGYYHRIGLLKGENSWGNVQLILRKNHFPREVRLILREYIDREKRKMVISKEAVVLLFCDDMIATVSACFADSKGIEPDYQKMINTVFMKQLESGMIDCSSITIGELQEIKKILMEERAYYDLLR